MQSLMIKPAPKILGRTDGKRSVQDWIGRQLVGSCFRIEFGGCSRRPACDKWSQCCTDVVAHGGGSDRQFGHDITLCYLEKPHFAQGNSSPGCNRLAITDVICVAVVASLLGGLAKKMFLVGFGDLLFRKSHTRILAPDSASKQKIIYLASPATVAAGFLLLFHSLSLSLSSSSHGFRYSTH
jgi:hypothetical protein